MILDDVEHGCYFLETDFVLFRSGCDTSSSALELNYWCDETAYLIQ